LTILQQFFAINLRKIATFSVLGVCDIVELAEEALLGRFRFELMIGLRDPGWTGAFNRPAAPSCPR